MLVTGGAGAIGAATAKLFADDGAHVVVVDLDADKAAAVGEGRPATARSASAATSPIPAAVRAAFDAAVAVYGGVDIVVSNAGAAWEGAIGELDDALLRKSFELNFFAHQSVAQNAVRIMQGAGHRRRAAVQRLEAGGQSRPEIRRLRPAQGGDAVPVAAICARLRRRRHPLQRRQRRPHPLGPADRRDDRQPLRRARPVGEGLHVAATCSARK